MRVLKNKGLSLALPLALVMILGFGPPAQATIDVTLDIAGAQSSPQVEQQTPGMLARTGFDPLPIGATAALFLAIGILSLNKQTRTERRRKS